MPLKNNCWLAVLFLGSVPAMAWAADDDPVSMDLLVQENVTLVTSSLPGGSPQDLASLTDGKTNPPLKIKLESGAALDLTYQLPAVVTWNQWANGFIKKKRMGRSDQDI